MESKGALTLRYRRLVAWVLMGASVAVVAFACDRGASSAKGENNVASTLAAPVAAESQPADSFDDAAFSLRMQPVGDYRVGAPGKVEVVLDAKPPYKINEKYPFKLKLEETAGLKFDTRTVAKDRVRVEGKRATMTVPLTPQSAGQAQVAGQFSFSVCNDERCLLERRDLRLVLKVK